MSTYEVTETAEYWRDCYRVANARANRWQTRYIGEVDRYQRLDIAARTLAETWAGDRLGSDRYCANELLTLLDEYREESA